MADEFVKMGQFVADYTQALKQGMDKFTGMLPILTEQKMSALAAEKLNTTADTFFNALKINMRSYVLVVELDPENFLANAVESGLDPFNMKETHLKSPKAKFGKPNPKTGVAYKYMRIPIGKEANGPGGKTARSQEIQDKINQVMNKPQFGMRKLKTMIDGTVVESQKVMSSERDTQGLYRVRKYTSVDEYHAGKAKPKWGLVMFRTMSEKPFTSKWDHPGIHPANIFKDTEQWLRSNLDSMLDTFLSNEIDKIEY